MVCVRWYLPFISDLKISSGEHIHISYLASKQSPWWWSMDTYKGVSSSIVTTTPLLLAKYFLMVFPHSVWPYNIGNKAAHVFIFSWKKTRMSLSWKRKRNFLHGPNGFFFLSFGHKKKSKQELTKHYFVKTWAKLDIYIYFI